MIFEKVTPSLPADKAGIKVGDTLVAVDGRVIKGLSRDEIVQLMRGEAGTPLALAILRPKESLPTKLTIVREIIQPGAAR